MAIEQSPKHNGLNKDEVVNQALDFLRYLKDPSSFPEDVKEDVKVMPEVTSTQPAWEVRNTQERLEKLMKMTRIREKLVTHTIPKMVRFTDSQRNALESAGKAIVPLAGASIKFLTRLGVPVYGDFFQKEEAYKRITQIKNIPREVAIDPDNFFIPNSENKTLFEQDLLLEGLEDGMRLGKEFHFSLGTIRDLVELGFWAIVDGCPGFCTEWRARSSTFVDNSSGTYPMNAYLGEDPYKFLKIGFVGNKEKLKNTGAVWLIEPREAFIKQNLKYTEDPPAYVNIKVID